MNIKPLIAFFIVVFIAGGMLIAQNQSMGGGKVNITAAQLESWFKMLPPEQLRGMSNQPEAKKILVDNLKEMFILGQEGERMGLANAPDAQSELSIMEKVSLAGTFRNLKGAENPALVQVSDQDKQEFFKKFPNAFEEFIASNPRLKAASEAQREALKPQFGELMILLERAKKSGLEKDPGYQMMYNVQRASYLAVRAQQQMRLTLPVSDAEIEAEFDKVKNDYAETRARHILVAFPEQRKQAEENVKAKKGEEAAAELPKANKPATKEEAKKLAEELLVRLKEKKEDFAELAKQYSDDPGSGKMGGDLGYFKKDVGFVPEFKEALFKLPVNGISDIVETQFGYHIIQVTEQKAAPAKPDEAMKLEMKDKVLDKKLAEKIESLKAKGTVTIEENFNFPAIAPKPAAAPLPNNVPPPQNVPGHEGHGHEGAEPVAKPESKPESKTENKSEEKSTGKEQAKPAAKAEKAAGK